MKKSGKFFPGGGGGGDGGWSRGGKQEEEEKVKKEHFKLNYRYLDARARSGPTSGFEDPDKLSYLKFTDRRAQLLPTTNTGNPTMKPHIGQKKTLACTGRDFGIVKSESNTPSEYQEPPNGEWWGPFHPDFGTSTGDEHAVGMVQPTLHPKFREPIYKTGLTSLPKFLNWYNTDPRPLNKAAKVSLLLHTTAILLLRYYYCVLRNAYVHVFPHRILSFSTNTPDPDQHGSAHRIGTDVRRQWMDL